MRLSVSGDLGSSAPISCLISARIAVADAAPPVSVATTGKEAAMASMTAGLAFSNAILGAVKPPDSLPVLAIPPGSPAISRTSPLHAATSSAQARVARLPERGDDLVELRPAIGDVDQLRGRFGEVASLGGDDLARRGALARLEIIARFRIATGEIVDELSGDVDVFLREIRRGPHGDARGIVKLSPRVIAAADAPRPAPLLILEETPAPAGAVTMPTVGARK